MPQAPTATPPRSASVKSDCGSIRPSTRGKWRALSLFLLHVAVALHVAHWWLTGKTITPVEPSEAMQTLGTEALVNAGFVLFALTILSTMIFGRFFCGWGCHLIAYQDLCTWILKKIGIRPQPFRSRTLLFVPLGAAIFMFIMPTAVRVIAGNPRAPYTAHFTTYDFWDRFPGWFVGLLTIFVCGFVIVYFLGNKGFCTYACPYGGFFGLADKIAPGKIRVTDACEQCGHCTATCSSNVRVHEEVHRFGMVVNPGCMKCMDCISVCPKDALYFGFGMPTVSRVERHPGKPRRYDFTWPEEFALAGLFVASVVILRKLYDGVPFLLALALASMSAYVLLTAGRYVYARSVRFARFQLRLDGEATRAGRVFALAAALWAVFIVHSGVVQLYTLRGRMALSAARAGDSGADGVPGLAARGNYDRAITLLERADALGLVPVANLLFDLAMAHVRRGHVDAGEACLQRAVAFSPQFAAGRYELAQLRKRSDDPEAAAAELREVLRIAPEFPKAHSDLADLLIARGRSAEAVTVLEGLIEQRPDVVAFHLALGLTLAHHDDRDRALASMRETAARWPVHPDAHYNLGATLASFGDDEAARNALEEAARLNPKSGLIHYTLAGVTERAGETRKAEAHLLAARKAEPFHAEYLKAWVAAVHRRGALDQETAAAELEAPISRAARFRLAFLYRAAGRDDDARRTAAEFAIRRE